MAVHRPRPLAHELRWLLAGWALCVALVVAPRPRDVADPDHELYYDYIDALNRAGKAMERLT